MRVIPVALSLDDAAQGPFTVHLEAFEVPVDVRIRGSRAAELAEVTREAWARCLRSDVDDAACQINVLFDDDETAVEAAQAAGEVASTSLSHLNSWLTTAVTIEAITASAGDLLMLHAGAVADLNTGRTAILVGESGAGKTTAVRVLGSHFGYVTDETVAFGPDLVMRPYPKPLSVIVEADPPVGKKQMAPDELGLVTPPAELYVGALLVLRRSVDGPDQPEFSPLTTVDALATLGEHTSYLAQLEQPLTRLANLVHAAGGAQFVHYRDAETLAAPIAELLETR